nr:aldo/keto reductase [Acidobacteriota bacterium]
MHSIPFISLNNGVRIPSLGYGVYKVPATDATALVSTALQLGYRSIDTAALYANEAEVGTAVREATGSNGWLSREDVFVTSKVWNDQQGYDRTHAAFRTSLAKLGLDYVDMFLIHWPCPEQGLYVETYRALEELYHDGLVRAIGVSNFAIEHLETLLAECTVVPAVNQIELHPRLAQEELRAFHAQHSIATEAWSPLARGSLLEDPTVMSIADRLGVTPAQVILRWHLQLGNIVIPKASSAQRMTANRNIFCFALDHEAMDLLAT